MGERLVVTRLKVCAYSTFSNDQPPCLPLPVDAAVPGNQGPGLQSRHQTPGVYMAGVKYRNDQVTI
jgi:hypothetical protein